LGAGIDVWGNSDEFRYTYQTLDGDGQIIARVASQENTDGWAKSGVMIRETLAANAKHAFMLVSPGNGTALQWRDTTGGASSNNNTGGFAAPYWVKLVRSGNMIAGFRSADGVAWIPQGSPVTIAMNRQVYIGLAVLGSGGDDDLNTSTFTNVSVTALTPTVATAAAASPSTVGVGGTTNLSVLGADDGGESNLTYTWAATTLPSGAPAPTFGGNGNNAAKNTTATFAKAGSYTLTITITDASGRSVTSSVGVTVAAAPTVTAASYDYHSALSFTFSNDLAASPVAGDLSVQALPGGATVTPTSVLWDAGTRTATFTFAAPFADGNYRATLATAGYTYDFFALAGDANRDRVVNFNDLLALAKNYNKTGATWADGDFTGDGVVNFSDLLLLAKNYNHTVAAPAPAPVVALAAPLTPSTTSTAPVQGVLKEERPTVFSTRRVAPPPVPAKPKAKAVGRPKAR
jgi:hypothetical protein